MIGEVEVEEREVDASGQVYMTAAELMAEEVRRRGGEQAMGAAGRGVWGPDAPACMCGEAVRGAEAGAAARRRRGWGKLRQDAAGAWQARGRGQRMARLHQRWGSAGGAEGSTSMLDPGLKANFRYFKPAPCTHDLPLQSWPAAPTQ